MSVQAPPLSDLQQRILDLLRRDGIATADVRDLHGERLWADAQTHVAPWVGEQSAQLATLGDKPESKDEFIVRRYMRQKPKIPFTLDSPWLRIGVADAQLGIVNAYRGLQTSLFYLDNWFTQPYAGQDERIASQRWHRDPEEEHVVKVFLYLSDVTEDAGPFEYLKGSPPGNRFGHLWPWGDEKAKPTDEEMAAAAPPEERVTMTGPAGTMIFCDTSGFHRGGFAKTTPRVLSIWSYVSPAAEDKSHRFEVDLEGRDAELSADARAALA
jgi:Phytanoyl-CoA dioxygenase (PhyH)